MAMVPGRLESQMRREQSSWSKENHGMSNLLNMILEAKRMIDALGPPPPSFKLVKTDAALRYVRVRVYPKRRAKSRRHWQRMDKKWRKRYGHRAIPTVYHAPDGRGNVLLVAHPTLYHEYARALWAGLTERGMI